MQHVLFSLKSITTSFSKLDEKLNTRSIVQKECDEDKKQLLEDIKKTELVRKKLYKYTKFLNKMI
jgi:hypothetical protein